MCHTQALSGVAPRSGTNVKLLRHRRPHLEHYTPHLPLLACYMKCPFRQLALSSTCLECAHSKNMHFFAVQSQSFVLSVFFLFFFGLFACLFYFWFKWELVFFSLSWFFFFVSCFFFFLKMWKLLRRGILMLLRKMTPLTWFKSWISRSVSQCRVFKRTVWFVVCHHCSLFDTFILGGDGKKLFFGKVVFQPFSQQLIVLIGRNKCYLIKHFPSQECLHI